MGGAAAAGVLFGRHAELAVLDGLLARSSAGTGGIVLLAGDPGIGKTRLAREGSARADGARVSWGACRESEGAPPLWPWTQVLGLGGQTVTADAAEGSAARFRLFERIGHAATRSACTAVPRTPRGLRPC